MCAAPRGKTSDDVRLKQPHAGPEAHRLRYLNHALVMIL